MTNRDLGTETRDTALGLRQAAERARRGKAPGDAAGDSELTHLRAANAALRRGCDTLARELETGRIEGPDLVAGTLRTLLAATDPAQLPQNPAQRERSATGKDVLNVCPVCGKNHWCCDGRKV